MKRGEQRRPWPGVQQCGKVPCVCLHLSSHADCLLPHACHLGVPGRCAPSVTDGMVCRGTGMPGHCLSFNAADLTEDLCAASRYRGDLIWKLREAARWGRR